MPFECVCYGVHADSNPFSLLAQSPAGRATSGLSVKSRKASPALVLSTWKVLEHLESVATGATYARHGVRSAAQRASVTSAPGSLLNRGAVKEDRQAMGNNRAAANLEVHAGDERKSVGAIAQGALAIGAFALGAFALGALALGALVIYRMRIGDLRANSVHFNRLAVDELTVTRLRVAMIEIDDQERSARRE
jgi:hypothetical protein